MDRHFFYPEIFSLTHPLIHEMAGQRSSLSWEGEGLCKEIEPCCLAKKIKSMRVFLGISGMLERSNRGRSNTPQKVIP
jgi:hypothetical protein